MPMNHQISLLAAGKTYQSAAGAVTALAPIGRLHRFDHQELLTVRGDVEALSRTGLDREQRWKD